MIYLIIFIVFSITIIVVIGLKIEDSKANKYNYSDETENRDYYYVNEYPFHSKYLLTQNEYNFYSRLKNITEPLNLQILAKIRLADLIEIDNNIQGKEWWALFGKIKSKHIDFCYCRWYENSYADRIRWLFSPKNRPTRKRYICK